MSDIVFEAVEKSYAGRRALDAVQLVVPDRSLTVLCGPPGSGKSVLLRLLVGLEAPDRGRILMGGTDITDFGPAARRVGYVPQSFALFPQMSVFENIAFPLRMQRSRPQETQRRVAQAAEVLRIGELLAKTPSQLSGGQKQRVAIARGMLKDASVFVLDDPLVGLDFKLREALMDDLKDMRATLGATFLYATSDSLEALTMAERLAVIDQGRIVEEAEVDQLYYQPAQLRSAILIGFPRCNAIPGRLSAGRCRNAIAEIGLVATSLDAAPEEVTITIRPEQVAYAPDRQPHDAISGVICGTGRITLVENLGAESVIYFEAGDTLLVSVPETGRVAHLDVGDDYPFAIHPAAMIMFDTRTGQRIGAGAPLDPGGRNPVLQRDAVHG